jgi:hypothetical protein
MPDDAHRFINVLLDMVVAYDRDASEDVSAAAIGLATERAGGIAAKDLVTGGGILANILVSELAAARATDRESVVAELRSIIDRMS